MAIAFVEIENANGGANPSVLGFTTTPTGCLFVGIIRANTTGQTLTVTDNLGTNTWTNGPQLTVGAGDVYYTFYAYNVNTNANQLTVTCTISGGAVFTRALCVSYSGVATSLALDKSSTNTGSGTSWTSTSVTTTSANEVVVNLVGGPSGNNFTPDGAFTSRGSVGTDMMIEDKIVSATGSFAPTVTVDTGGNFGDFILTFADTPLSGPTVPQEMPGIINWPIDWGPRYV